MADVSLALLVLKTRQVEQLRAFYQTLGVDLVEEKHGKGPVHFAGRAGAVVIEVYPLSDDSSPVDSSTRLGFAVEDVAEVIRAGVLKKAVTTTDLVRTRHGYHRIGGRRHSALPRCLFAARPR